MRTLVATGQSSVIVIVMAIVFVLAFVLAEQTRDAHEITDDELVTEVGGYSV